MISFECTLTLIIPFDVYALQSVIGIFFYKKKGIKTTEKTWRNKWIIDVKTNKQRSEYQYKI